jgi:hypothetical protein
MQHNSVTQETFVKYMTTMDMFHLTNSWKSIRKEKKRRLKSIQSSYLNLIRDTIMNTLRQTNMEESIS